MPELKCNCGDPACTARLKFEWNQTFGMTNNNGPICLFVDKHGEESLIYLSKEQLKDFVGDMVQGLLDLFDK